MSPPPTPTTLSKRPAPSDLMMPPPPPKRARPSQTILPEHEYESILSHIIARDFFPGLLETQTQSEYLDALDSQNQDWIAEAEGRVRASMTPRSSSSSALASRASRASQQAPPSTEKLKSLSLAAFQSLYTSEDDASFSRVLARQSAKKKARYHWAETNHLPSKRLLLAAAAASQPPPNSKPDQPAQDLSSRPANIAPRPYTARNALMFHPETHSSPQTPIRHARGVFHAATRFPSAVLDTGDDGGEDVASSAGLSTIDRAIRAQMSNTTTLDAGAETPRVNGYGYVDPEPKAHELDAVAAHGSLAAARAHRRDETLRAMREGLVGTGPNGFSIQAQSRREDIRDRLVDRARGKNNKEKEGDGAGHKTAATPGAMTPAARALFERVGKTPRTATSLSGWDGTRVKREARTPLGTPSTRKGA